MNTTEKKYAVSRIDGMFYAKRRAIEDQTYTEGIYLSFKDKIKLITNGTVKPRKTIAVPSKYNGLSCDEIFDFSKYETSAATDEKKRTKLLDALRAEAHKVRDRVMLGDSEEALKLIEAFEKF